MQPSIPQPPPSSGVLNEQRVFQRIDVIRQARCDQHPCNKRITNSVICGELKCMRADILSLTQHSWAAKSVADFASRSLPACRPSAPPRSIPRLPCRWPNKPPAVQALGVKRQSNSTVPEDLGQVTATTCEDVEIASVRVRCRLSGTCSARLVSLRSRPSCSVTGFRGSMWLYG
jgi:hypothetical protein